MYMHTIEEVLNGTVILWYYGYCGTMVTVVHRDSTYTQWRADVKVHQR